MLHHQDGHIKRACLACFSRACIPIGAVLSKNLHEDEAGSHLAGDVPSPGNGIAMPRHGASLESVQPAVPDPQLPAADVLPTPDRNAALSDGISSWSSMSDSNVSTSGDASSNAGSTDASSATESTIMSEDALSTRTHVLDESLMDHLQLDPTNAAMEAARQHAAAAVTVAAKALQQNRPAVHMQQQQLLPARRAQVLMTTATTQLLPKLQGMAQLGTRTQQALMKHLQMMLVQLPMPLLQQLQELLMQQQLVQGKLSWTPGWLP